MSTSDRPVSGRVAATGAPSPEELMLFVDGELEPARARELAEYFQANPHAARQVDALRWGGKLLAEHALAGATAADDIVERVMSSIAEGAAPVSLRAERARRLPVARFALVFGFAAAAACFLGVGILRYGRDLAHLPMRAELNAMVAPAIEVDSVDFGEHGGSIFYVTTSSDGTPIPVVWLNDDDSNPDSGEPL